VEATKILEELFDRKTLAVLRLFIQNPDKQYYLREVAKLSRVPLATVFRIVHRLTAMGVLAEVKLRKFKVYQYGATKEAKFVEQLIEIRKGAVEDFVDACRTIDGIQQVVLHGKRQKDRANLLIIGSGVRPEPLMQAAAKVREQLGFTIIYLTLEPAQYEQMVHMGLYAEERQVLLDRGRESAPHES
jgi:Fe2+ or Zn2+ uptake regulation protein